VNSASQIRLLSRPACAAAPREEFSRFIRAEFDRWGPVIKQAGVRIGD
jgi:hypothetical protein